MSVPVFSPPLAGPEADPAFGAEVAGEATAAVEPGDTAGSFGSVLGGSVFGGSTFGSVLASAFGSVFGGSALADALATADGAGAALAAGSVGAGGASVDGDVASVTGVADGGS